MSLQTKGQRKAKKSTKPKTAKRASSSRHTPEKMATKTASATAKKILHKTVRQAKISKPKPLSKKHAKSHILPEFEFFEHTADAKFRAYGKTFADALANSAKATISVMTDSRKIKSKETRKVAVDSKSRESLVYDFLEKLIFLIDTEGFLTTKVSKIRITETNGAYQVDAELKGDNARNYDVHTCIKAVTYNDMEINETKKMCTIQVVLDI